MITLVPHSGYSDSGCSRGGADTIGLSLAPSSFPSARISAALAAFWDLPISPDQDGATQQLRSFITQSYPEAFLLSGRNYLGEVGTVSVSPIGAVNTSPLLTSWASLALGLPRSTASDDLGELDRYLVGVLALRDILLGSPEAYSRLTASQSELVKLTFSTFRQLHLELSELVCRNGSEEFLDSVLALASISDLSKVNSINEMISDLGGSSLADPDARVAFLMETYPSLIPSFERLSPHFRDVLFRVQSSGFLFGTFIFGESYPVHLRGLRELALTCPTGFALAIAEQIYDMAGARGHRAQPGSVTLDEPNVQEILTALRFFQRFADTKMTPEALVHYYRMRKAKDFGLEQSEPVTPCLVRYAQMLRLGVSHKPDIAVLKEVFTALPPRDKATLAEQAHVSGLNPNIQTLPCYLEHWIGLPLAWERHLHSVRPHDSLSDIRRQVWGKFLEVTAEVYRAASAFLCEDEEAWVSARSSGAFHVKTSSFLRHHCSLNSVGQRDLRISRTELGEFYLH